MIYLKLFLTFLQIGAVSFGGGYAMISLIREKCLVNGWLNESELMNFIAVSESTPGPISVNLATFIGSSKGGVFGAFMATFGLVLPSFIIILIIAMLLKNFINYKGTKAVISGIKPVVIGLILATSATMFLSTIINVTTINSKLNINIYGIIILLLIIIMKYIYKKTTKKNVSPIILILFCAFLGIIFYQCMPQY